MEQGDSLVKNLLEATHRIAEATLRVQRQEALVAQLQEGGQSTDNAQTILQESRNALERDKAEHTRLLRELEKHSDSTWR